MTGACTRLGPQISDPGQPLRQAGVPDPGVGSARCGSLGGLLSFSILRIAADPYANRCAPSVWGAVPQSGSPGPRRDLELPAEACIGPG